MARLTGDLDGLNNDKEIKTLNVNLDDVSVSAERMQNMGYKRKDATISLTDVETKKKKTMVEQEASPKWLPSTQ
ncbi:hypothetical protein RND71_039102 [Anisodus tanguticus]|uniref:Uncharacterized protein n=1 Tax=Anisodus tanguticus TaxID=243964 RepID=A0AAE1UV09_9SOLA|nr:hypothetical protein RND71_039102 [Anisodus tanguticus]